MKFLYWTNCSLCQVLKTSFCPFMWHTCPFGGHERHRQTQRQTDRDRETERGGKGAREREREREKEGERRKERKNAYQAEVLLCFQMLVTQLCRQRYCCNKAHMYDTYHKLATCIHRTVKHQLLSKTVCQAMTLLNKMFFLHLAALIIKLHGIKRSTPTFRQALNFQNLF